MVRNLTFRSSTTPPDPFAEIDAIQSIECGKEAAKHFGFAEEYRNLNHGSFGTFPLIIKNVLRSFQDQCEARPDWFIRYEYPRKLDEAREAIAKILNAPVEACVFVSNATTGVNTILRNLVYQPGDVIIYFATIYGACHKTIDYLMEMTPVEARQVLYTYPCEDEHMVKEFEKTIKDLKAEGKNPKVAIFDTIASMPGVRMPFERLTEVCKAENVLSCIDGAHSIGQIPLDLAKLDPDFYVSNCHKWLHVPRGCAVFYVPLRNQALMRSTLPTSHGFVPKEGATINNPLPPTTKSEFVNNFEFVGTIDNAPYLSVPAAIFWRSKITYDSLRGEEAIMQYNIDLAKSAGSLVSKILGETEVMDNSTHSLTNCAFANVALPVVYSDDAEALKKAQWISQVLVDEYETFMAILLHDRKLWVRLSAQVYLTDEDFVWAGETLKIVCDRAEKGEWK